jgi:toxin ParE1/3/4
VGLIRRSATAYKDFGEIWDYVAKDSPDAADELLRSFDSTIELLSDFPHAGRDRSDPRPRLRSFSVGNYVIYYRPMRGGVEVARVVDAARDVHQIFKPRR